MAATNYITPALGNETYTQVPPSNFGEAYAAGIGAAGKSLSDAITAVGGEYLQNRQVDDTLKAMNQNKILSDDEYQSVAGKSLGTKQTMLGMYAGQWLADQAQNRAVALQKGQYSGQIDVEHAKLLDTIKALQGKYGPQGGQAVGVQPGKQPAPAPVTGGSNSQTSNVVGPVAPVVGQPVQKNMLLAPGVQPGQMTNPKTGQIVRGWTMPDGSFRPNP